MVLTFLLFNKLKDLKGRNLGSSFCVAARSLSPDVAAHEAARQARSGGGAAAASGGGAAATEEEGSQVVGARP